ncbi:tyrosine-type recombinase/integrase [Furfurilactobacillus siliginis]|uniref:tyrosine-type recombinase/integrase n=1 Tax=Furfurilactobacillus siliginis TaxID=348151 RepID=UPI003530765A
MPASAYSGAVRLGYVDVNPTHCVTYPREYNPTNNGKKLHYFTADQVDKFLETSLNERDPFLWYQFYLVVFDAGLRKGEAAGLWCKDIDLETRIIHIRRQRLFKAETSTTIVYDDPETQNSIRDVPMIGRVVDGFYAYFRERFGVTFESEIKMALKQYAYEPAFVHMQGQTIGLPIREQTTNSIFNRIIKRAGLPHIRLHDGRHTNAVRMRQAGVSLEDIGGILGHKNVETTQIYAEITPDVKEKAIRKIDDFNQNYQSNLSTVNQSVNHSNKSEPQKHSRKEI